MIISEDLMQKAKNKAENILKMSIVSLAISLDVDLESLNGNYNIPVDESDVNYHAYLSLQRMCQSLERIQST